MKIYLIRHGETSWNTLGRLQGRTDIELNENGIRLAKITGEKLKDVHFDLAIASPLKRAYETAGLVLGDRNIPILTDERIEEISFGEWEGLCCRMEELTNGNRIIRPAYKAVAPRKEYTPINDR